MVVEAEPGESVYRAIQRVIARANRTQQEHILRHNGVEVRVYPGSHEYDIVEKWTLKRELHNLQKT